jgi:hypothetical protein
VTRRRAVLALACVAGAAAGAAAIAVSEPTRSQTFFRDRLIDDKRTLAPIRDALRDGSAFVDRSILFADLTGDDKDDAVVRVQTGGAAGAVAVYVFSTEGGKSLRVRFRAQRLTQASVAVRDGALSFRTAEYAAGDELCCPAKLVESAVAWEGGRFAVTSTRDIDGPAAPR